MSRRIGVMYLGRLVEIGASREMTTAPRHPYTQTLISAIPEPDPTKRAIETKIKGEIDAISQRPTGCVFRLRCQFAEEICAAEEPQLRSIAETGKSPVILPFRIPESAREMFEA